MLFSRNVLMMIVWLATELVCAAETKALRNIKPGERIPESRVTGLSGKIITKGDSAGRVLVLIFARPDNAKSLSALRAVQRLHKADQQGGPAVPAVATKPDKGDYFAALAKQWGFEFAIALDSKRERYGALGLIVAPTTLVVDRSGFLRYELAHVPPNYERTLQIHVDHLLGRIAESEHDALLAEPNGAGRHTRDMRTRRLALVRALIQKKEVNVALTILQKLCEEQDDEAVAAFLESTLLDDGLVEQAQQVLKPFGDHKTRSGAMNLVLGHLALARGQAAAAERFVDAAAKFDDQRARSLYLLGGLHERRGETSKAFSCYRQALEHTFDDFAKTPKNQKT